MNNDADYKQFSNLLIPNLYGPNPPFQSYLFFALAQNLVPEGHKQAVLDNLIEDIMETRNGHLGTGILGTKHMFDVLMNEGQEEVLHTIVTRLPSPAGDTGLQMKPRHFGRPGTPSARIITRCSGR